MKLYLITHEELPPGQQAVQAAHALRQFTHEHPDEDAHWFENSNTLAFLAAPNREAVGVIWKEALHRGIPVAAFHEPDRGNELTAIALGPTGKRLTRRLKVALRS